jgi:Protein of unknown function (DUF3489)
VLQLTGISSHVDSCVDMVMLHANKTYRYLSDANRRWIDQDDLIQEGLITAACIVEPQYESGGPAKFSTYLHTGLRWFYSREFKDKLSQAGRECTGLVELDGLKEEPKGLSHRSSPGQTGDAVQLFIQLCARVSGRAVELMVSGLLLGKWSATAKAPILKEIREVAERQGVKMDDLAPLIESESARKKALTMIGTARIIGLGSEMEAWVLECIECGGQCGLSALRSQPQGYFVETMTCRKCYLKMKAADPDTSCFGKPKTQGQEGYTETDIECRLHCRDRKVCRQFTREKMNPASKLVHPRLERGIQMVEANVEELDDVSFDNLAPVKAKAPAKVKPNGHDKAAEKPVKQAKSKGKAKKAAKPAKKAKAAKAPKKEAKAAKGPAKKIAKIQREDGVTRIGKKAHDTGVTVGAGSKTAQVLKLLKEGATREKIAKATGWVDHSVRGFICTCNKRFGIVIESEKNKAGDLIYKIVEGKVNIVERESKKKAAKKK